MTILTDVKAAMRISTAATAYDAELADLILAAKADLGIAGVLPASIIDTDALIKKAIITYCKVEFGYDNPDAERLQISYNLLKDRLTLSSAHAYYAVTFTVKDALAAAIRSAVVALGDVLMETDSTGTAIFYLRENKNIAYTVYAAGYVPSFNNLLDVTASQTVNIVLAAV